MEDLTLAARTLLWGLMGMMGLLTLMVARWQWQVVRGAAMPNPDGSHDDWHQQPTHYGIAVADLLVACPANALGLVLVFLAPRWGFYLLAMASFWWVWANVMTTATSLRFHQPEVDLEWFLTFPFGILVGLAYLAFTVAWFDVLYRLG